MRLGLGIAVVALASATVACGGDGERESEAARQVESTSTAPASTTASTVSTGSFDDFDVELNEVQYIWVNETLALFTLSGRFENRSAADRVDKLEAALLCDGSEVGTSYLPPIFTETIHPLGEIDFVTERRVVAVDELSGCDELRHALALSVRSAGDSYRDGFIDLSDAERLRSGSPTGVQMLGSFCSVLGPDVLSASFGPGLEDRELAARMASAPDNPHLARRGSSCVVSIDGVDVLEIWLGSQGPYTTGQLEGFFALEGTDDPVDDRGTPPAYFDLDYSFSLVEGPEVVALVARIGDLAYPDPWVIPRLARLAYNHAT